MARQLASDVGLGDPARFVDSDVYAAAEALNGQQFDVVSRLLGSGQWR
jgi:hypothetical protein